jgi:hypothetical protein
MNSFLWCHDTRHNGIQDNGTKQNNQHDNTRHTDGLITPDAENWHAECCIFIFILSIILVSKIIMNATMPQMLHFYHYAVLGAAFFIVMLGIIMKNVNLLSVQFIIVMLSIIILNVIMRNVRFLMLC